MNPCKALKCSIQLSIISNFGLHFSIIMGILCVSIGNKVTMQPVSFFISNIYIHPLLIVFRHKSSYSLHLSVPNNDNFAPCEIGPHQFICHIGKRYLYTDPFIELELFQIVRMNPIFMNKPSSNLRRLMIVELI